MTFNEQLKSERGLTLVEIIVVLIIIGVVMSVIGTKLFSTGERAKYDANHLKMTKLKNSINEYQLRYNGLPPNLDALVNGAPGLNGFLKIVDPDEFADLWTNKPYVYQVDGSGRGYTIKSLGRDGKDGGSDVDADDVLAGP